MKSERILSFPRGFRVLSAAIVCTSFAGASSYGAPQWERDLKSGPSNICIDHDGNGKGEVLSSGPATCQMFSGADGAAVWNLPLQATIGGSWKGGETFVFGTAFNPRAMLPEYGDITGSGGREMIVVRTDDGPTRFAVQVYNVAKALKWQSPVIDGYPSFVRSGHLDVDSARELFYVNARLDPPFKNELIALDGKNGALQFTKSFDSDEAINIPSDGVDFDGKGSEELIYTVDHAIHVCNGEGKVLWTLNTDVPHPGDYTLVHVKESWLPYAPGVRKLPDIDGNGNPDLLVEFLSSSFDPISSRFTMTTVLRLYDAVTKKVRWQTPDFVSATELGQTPGAAFSSFENVDSNPNLELVCFYRNKQGKPVLQVFDGRQDTSKAVPRFTRDFPETDAALVNPIGIDVNNDGVNDVTLAINDSLQAFNGLTGTSLWKLPLSPLDSSHGIQRICNGTFANPSMPLVRGAWMVFSDVNADGKRDALVVLSRKDQLVDAAPRSNEHLICCYDIQSKMLNWQKPLDLNHVRVQVANGDADSPQEVFTFGFPNADSNGDTEQVRVLDGRRP